MKTEWKECTIANLGEVVGGATPSTKNLKIMKMVIYLGLLQKIYQHSMADTYIEENAT
jgi:hypothetical protein